MNKQALESLLAKVEAGDDTNDGSMYRAFGEEWVHSYDAYKGSVDAFITLMEAVLPDYHFMLTASGAAVSNGKTGNDHRHVSVFATADIPARAGLIAIIKALIEEAGE